MLAKKQKSVLMHIFIPILSIAFAAVSWLTNFGWLRAYLTVYAFPFLHAGVFLAVNVFVSFYAERCPKLTKLNSFYVLTYLLTHILLPDFGDDAVGYFFFGVVQCGSFHELFAVLAALSFISHNIICVIQIVMMLNERIKEKRAAHKE